MTISLFGSDTYDNTASTTSVTLTWPNTDADDYALLIVNTSDTGPPSATPTGFTQIYQLNPTNSGSGAITIFEKVCTGSESGTITVNLLSTGNRASAILVVFRGVDPADPIDGAIEVFDETVAQTTNDAPAHTLVDADCGIIVFLAERASVGSTSFTPPTGFASNYLDAINSGTGGTITAFASDSLNTARAASTVVNPGVWTSDNAVASANRVLYTIALKPLAVEPEPEVYRPGIFVFGG